MLALKQEEPVMIDEIFDKAGKNIEENLDTERMYFNWYFYVDYYVTPLMRVYKKNQLVCACKMALN